MGNLFYSFEDFCPDPDFTDPKLFPGLKNSPKQKICFGGTYKLDKKTGKLAYECPGGTQPFGDATHAGLFNQDRDWRGVGDDPVGHPGGTLAYEVVKRLRNEDEFERAGADTFYRSKGLAAKSLKTVRWSE